MKKQLNEISHNKLTIKNLTINVKSFTIILSDNESVEIRTYNKPSTTIDIEETWSSFIFAFSDETEITIQKKEAIAFIQNRLLPSNPPALKILGIGNSFTEDATEYLPSLLKAAGLKSITVARIFNGGLSFQKHWENYTNNKPIYYYDKTDPQTNSWRFHKSEVTFADALADEKWDIIVIQQVSDDAGIHKTFQPYLNNLIKTILSKHPNVHIAWHMTWAYSTNSSHPGFIKYNNNQNQMYQAIIGATKKMEIHTGIRIIIPSGTAIQNLRATSLNNPPFDLTRDGYHSDLGAGRYVEACTWYQTLIAPCFNIPITNNRFRVNAGNIPVTNENADLIQHAAQLAVKNKYEISNLQ